MKKINGIFKGGCIEDKFRIIFNDKIEKII